jgi:hypothetical protein
LINSLICIIVGILFYFYTNEFKDEISRRRVITYFIFGGYFIFSGFLGLKITFATEFKIIDFDIFKSSHLFSVLSLISNVLFGIFIYNVIKKERDVISNSKT